ncbi:hypothetical protein [Mesorhizobium sp. WSM3224]|nr:hypothetical protein [Mesorhizobium sp. WSM3224]
MIEKSREVLFILLIGAALGVLATTIVHDWWTGANAFYEPAGPWKQPV